MTLDYPAVLESMGRGAPIRIEPVSGGCIANTAVAIFEDGSSVFFKSGVPGSDDAFRCEARGLEELALSRAIRVPRVLAVSGDALVLEFIAEGRAGKHFFDDFGRCLARLHSKRGAACGFMEDNLIGSTPQLNAPVRGPWPGPPGGVGDGSDWPEFFIVNRLRFQLDLARGRGHGGELQRLFDRAEPFMHELLTQSTEPPSLLHGDLWSGNFICDDKGDACLIDPAVYYGHRESDLAMTRLFGGFGPDFYRAYQDEWPLADGHQDRLPAYQLYHLLNHLNLFGVSYYAQCERILKHYATK